MVPSLLPHPTCSTIETAPKSVHTYLPVATCNAGGLVPMRVEGLTAQSHIRLTKFALSNHNLGSLFEL